MEGGKMRLGGKVTITAFTELSEQISSGCEFYAIKIHYDTNTNFVEKLYKYI